MDTNKPKFIDPSSVSDLESLITFIKSLSQDAAVDEAAWSNTERKGWDETEWKNGKISTYLAAIAAAIEDHSPKDGMKLDDSNPYRAIAMALYVGKIYE